MRAFLLFTALILISTGDGLSQEHKGFFNFSWDAEEGKIWLDLTGKMDTEFIYATSMSGGVGSNDIGLDRNQLGRERIVKFVRSGPKVLMLEANYQYRAVSDNPEERRAVEEAFAKSVTWGFKAESRNGKVMVDLTPFLLRDAHQVARVLKRNRQGSYKADESRSMVNLDRTKSFPKNTEFDAMVTFTGEAEGDWIRSVAPDPDIVTVHLHHSFIALPDPGYDPRVYDPRSGFIPLEYYDYAQPIDRSIERKVILRHRLEKKDPGAEVSDPVEPIIYYIDRGCPEPIRSALIEGALWWDQAFAAAGYRNAFQVKDLPEGADPLDVRYNMINWVHRSTRGWSYGTSIIDPRTGEILKGHVLLGSLRVRQDYLIAQGLAGDFSDAGDNSSELTNMALQRLKQLSAHEVGHTLGLMHNFAASVNDRASVMDYPHPYITLDDSGNPDFSEAYDDKIGAWDKRMILYGYQDFPDDQDEAEGLKEIVAGSIAMGLDYMTDTDARPAGGAHPRAHLWDNGEDAVAELRRLTELRRHALDRFGTGNIPEGTHLAYLEQILVPLYYNHRYQVEAVSKLIGGVDYTYQVKGDGQPGPRPVDANTQMQATAGLLQTLKAEFLELDLTLVSAIPPQPAGYGRHRELFESHAGLVFDPIAVAEGSVDHTLQMMLHPQRLARIYNQSLYSGDFGSPSDYLYRISEYIRNLETTNERERSLALMVEKRYALQLLRLVSNGGGQQQVVADAMLALSGIEQHARTSLEKPAPGEMTAHYLYLRETITDFRLRPETFKVPPVTDLPPGAPIGCGHDHE